MINILLVENEVMHFRIIRDALLKYFGNHVKIYPENIKDKDHNLNDLNYLIHKFQEEQKKDKPQDKKFNDVLEHYKQIDLFIVDATLTAGDDDLGVDFLDEVYTKASGKKVMAILISGTDEKKAKVKATNTPYVSKIKHGIQDHFTAVLIDEITKLFPSLGTVGEETEKPEGEISADDDKNNGNKDSMGGQDDGTPPKPKNTFRTDLKKRGKRYAFHMLWLYFIGRIERRVIDKMVYILFYLLIIITICCGGYNVISSIISSSFMNHEETRVLKTAEEIFLNLLPINIVFGFFNYYKTNTRISLLEEGNIHSVDHVNSTRAMNLTKKLFVSSIISYVIIKMIELMFVKDTAADLKVLIPGGCLLALLMGYFIFLDRKNH